MGGVCERIVASERMPRRGRGAASSAGRYMPGEGERDEEGGGERDEANGGGERGEDNGVGEREACMGGGDFKLRGVLLPSAIEEGTGDSLRRAGWETEEMSDAEGL